MTTTQHSRRIVVLLGSLRAESVNRRIAEALRDRAPAGLTVEIAERLDELPFYNEDLDQPQLDLHPAVVSLRATVAGADAVLAVTPEYNGSMPAVLKNAIDWLSRPYGEGAIVGKPFGVVGTTPTPYGGQWAHEHAVRSATIAGARVVEDVVVSQTSVEVDVLGDPAVLGRFHEAVRRLVELERAA